MTKDTVERTLRLSLLELPWGQGRLVVRDEMRSLGLSYDDLAFHLRSSGYTTTPKTIGRWLREGGTVPSVDALRAIIGVLAEITVEDSAKGRWLSPEHSPYSGRPSVAAPIELHAPNHRPPSPSSQVHPDKNRPKDLDGIPHRADIADSAPVGVGDSSTGNPQFAGWAAA